jgi:hypothetical protein
MAEPWRWTGVWGAAVRATTLNVGASDKETPVFGKREDLSWESVWNPDRATRRTLRNSSAEGAARNKEELGREQETAHTHFVSITKNPRDAPPHAALPQTLRTLFS